MIQNSKSLFSLKYTFLNIQSLRSLRLIVIDIDCTVCYISVVLECIVNDILIYDVNREVENI